MTTAAIHRTPVRSPYSILLIALGAIALLAIPWLAAPFYLRVSQQILLFGGLAIAWSMLGGFTNYWSFGHTAFVGLGAFASGLLEQQLGAGIPAFAKMLAGMGFAMMVSAVIAVAIAIPVLRLRGIYFAIGMLAFAEILGEATRNFDIFQGAIGFTFPGVMVPGVSKVQLFYYLFLLLFVVNAVIFIVLRRSRVGIGLVCIGQDEDTAAMLGVPTERYKLAAFVLSAVLASAAGVLYGHSLGFITAGSVFRIDISLNLILFSMIGGIGTLAGPVIGATLMIVLTQVVLGDLLDFHMMLTGALLIVIVLAAPKGIVGLARRLCRRSPGRRRETVA